MPVAKHRIYTTSVASVYPHYVTKVEKKGRSKSEVDMVIRWLTGYSQSELDEHLENRTDFETFFAKAPQMNPARSLIKGVICGVRIEEIEEPVMREIRYMDKLVDELRLQTGGASDPGGVVHDYRTEDSGDGEVRTRPAMKSP